MNHATLRALGGALLLAFTTCLYAAPPAVEVDAAVARATPPGVPNGAIFFTLRNPSDQPRRLTAARTPVAARAELHNHIADNGVMRMRQVPAVEVPPRGEVVFQPGGLHVMLMGLHQGLKPGAQVPLTLVFDDGSLELEVPVRDMRGMQPGQGMMKP